MTKRKKQVPQADPKPSEEPGATGRPPHEPTTETRAQVEALVSFGIQQTQIAGMLGIDPKTLRKHYGHEIDHGTDKANALVGQSLFAKATGSGPQAVTAAIFWMKCRAGWKETMVLAGDKDHPLQIEDKRNLNELSGAEIDARIAAALGRIESLAEREAGQAEGSQRSSDVRQLN